MRVSIPALAAIFLGAALLHPAPARAQGVSFSRDIVPILKESCSKCHNTKQPTGGFSVVSFAAIEKGGKSGKVLAPKAAESKLIKLMEGTMQPKMPPGQGLPKAQIDKFKAWIDGGSKIDVAADAVVIQDTTIPAIKVPKIATKVPTLPQAASLAWSNDGKVLAIGTYQTVRLVNPADGKVIKELGGHTDIVHHLAFSPDGKLLAAAGGPPAQQGEVKLWDVATGNLVRTISGHTDYIYTCSWSPDGKTLATASYDKLVKLWKVDDGSELKTLKDHADAVYAVAFNPAGNLIATGSADRTIKMWDVASGKRIYTLTGHNDTIYSIAWNKAGNQITSTGQDRTVRTWNVNPQNGNQARNITPHAKSVNEVIYSADGTKLCTVSDDRSAIVYNAANGGQMQAIKDQGDALVSAAFSPDGAQIAVGGFDGTVRVFNVADGKLISTLVEVPKAPEPKPAVAPAPKPATAPLPKPKP